MFSERMFQLGSRRSSIRELFEYGKMRAELVGRENVFDFSLGNPTVPPPEEVKDAIINIIENSDSVAVHGYTSAQGDASVRARISEHLSRKYRLSVSPDRIYMTCGAAASLVISISALRYCDKDEFVAVAPYFPEYKVFVEETGAAFKTVEPDYANFQINFDSLSEVVNENTRAVIINSPNNPSGAVYREETLRNLADFLCVREAEYGHPIYIISDEPYREIIYDCGEYPSVMRYYSDTIMCYSYSKSLSLPGERIGYIAVSDNAKDSSEIYAAVCGAGRAHGYVCAPSLFQKVAGEVCGIHSDIGVYRKNRDILYNGLTDLGYSCVHPDGAFYLFVKAPGGNSISFGKAAKKRDLLIVPGDDFGCPGYMRVSYCVSTEMIKRAMPVFKKLMEESCSDNIGQ